MDAHHVFSAFHILSQYMDHLLQEERFVKLCAATFDSQSQGLQEKENWLPCLKGKLEWTFLAFVPS